MIFVDVITSYSIHYTKLYDAIFSFGQFHHAVVNTDGALFGLDVLFEQSTNKRVIRRIITAVGPIEPVFGSGKRRTRITSYNVCYTKLLRGSHVAAGSHALQARLPVPESSGPYCKRNNFV